MFAVMDIVLRQALQHSASPWFSETGFQCVALGDLESQTCYIVKDDLELPEVRDIRCKPQQLLLEPSAFCLWIGRGTMHLCVLWHYVPPRLARSSDYGAGDLTSALHMRYAWQVLCH